MPTPKRRRDFLKAYINSNGYQFLIEVINIIPWELCFFSTVEQVNCRLYNWIVIFIRLLRFTCALEPRDGVYRLIRPEKASIKILMLVYQFFLFAHVMGALLFAIGMSEYQGGIAMNPHETTWIEIQKLHLANAFTQYCASTYWAMIVVCTIGYGDITASTQTEQATVVIFALTASMAYAQIFGSVITYLQGYSQSQVNLVKDFELVQQFGYHNKLSTNLIKELIQYKEEMWKINRGYNMKEIMKHFPETILEDIMMHLHKSLVLKVPMFSECHESFIRRLVCILEIQIFLENEYICRHGQMGTGMYFLRRGRCTVLIPTVTGEEKAVALMTDGSFFGEVTLLANSKRTATVRSDMRTEVGFLAKRDFEDVMVLFPDYMEKFEDIAMKRINRDSANRDIAKVAIEKKKAGEQGESKLEVLAEEDELSQSFKRKKTLERALSIENVGGS